MNILLEAVETSQNSLSMIDIYREQFENESIDIDSNNNHTIHNMPSNSKHINVIKSK